MFARSAPYQLLLLVVVVVCSVGPPSVTAKPCRVKAKQGLCVAPDDCPELERYLQKLQFYATPDAYRAFLGEHVCDRDKYGTIHICCTSKPSKTLQPPSRETVMEYSECDDTEDCVPLQDCQPLYAASLELQKRYNKTLHRNLRKNYCYRETNRVHVCCGDGEELEKRVGWQPCKTPFQDDGKCVPPARCGLVDNPNAVSTLMGAFLVGCDPVNGKSQICCPEAELQFDVGVGMKCSTSRGADGRCTESERCLDFVESKNRERYVRKNWCYTNLQQIDYLCCAEDRISFAEPVDFETRAGEETACTTPTNRAGQCVRLAECTPIANLLRQISTRGTAATAEEAFFLRSSVCTTAGTTGYSVCCDANSVRPATATVAPTVAAAPVSTASGLLAHRNIGLLDRTSCGQPNLDNKISFGERAQLFQYPWMAMLIYRATTGDTERAECAGTIINTRYILTAAHCIDGQQERLRYIRVGEFDTRTDPDCEADNCAAPIQRYDIEQTLIHPNFTRVVRSGHDIGLIRLNRAIDFSSGDVAPVCLPFSSDLAKFDPTLFWITGWGLTERLEASPVLLQARIPSVRCSLDDYAICAGYANGTLHCEGDSGGPMKAQVPEFNFRYVQYGVISAGPSCGVRGVPGVSSRVAYFMQWILDNIRA